MVNTAISLIMLQGLNTLNLFSQTISDQSARIVAFLIYFVCTCQKTSFTVASTIWICIDQCIVEGNCISCSNQNYTRAALTNHHWLLISMMTLKNYKIILLFRTTARIIPSCKFPFLSL